MIHIFAGYCWRFVSFRWVVVAWCAGGWIGADWLAVNTPLVWSLREVALTEGRYDDAAVWSRILREAGWN